MYEYINNSGSSFSRPQRNKMTQLSEEMSSYYNFLMYIQKEKQFDSIPELIRLQGSVLAMVENIRKSQLKRVKKKEGSTLSSLLILEVLADTRNILLYSVNFINTFRKFVLLRDKTR
jgi:Na+/phosphate symporter